MLLLRKVLLVSKMHQSNHKNALAALRRKLQGMLDDLLGDQSTVASGHYEIKKGLLLGGP
jgi:hypothetical protein